ncbi:unnamed protein product [Cuscuta campestris]|uniref:Uncharacterized protein n=1 Tax=Cuscuta campestris TaxID=132261 RepID=A0A484MK34_9ASTE|nr:unnamed protein product [Cuscuta campestris]
MLGHWGINIVQPICKILQMLTVGRHGGVAFDSDPSPEESVELEPLIIVFRERDDGAIDVALEIESVHQEEEKATPLFVVRLREAEKNWNMEFDIGDRGEGKMRGFFRSGVEGEMLNEDGASVSSPVDHFGDEDDMTAEEQLNRSTRNGRPEETSEASELQTVDLVDRPAVHGRPSERQKDGPLGVQPTVDVVDRSDNHGRLSEGQKHNLERDDETVDRVEENGRPSLRQKEDAREPLQTVDPVDRSTVDPVDRPLSRTQQRPWGVVSGKGAQM